MKFWIIVKRNQFLGTGTGDTLFVRDLPNVNVIPVEESGVSVSNDLDFCSDDYVDVMMYVKRVYIDSWDGTVNVSLRTICVDPNDELLGIITSVSGNRQYTSWFMTNESRTPEEILELAGFVKYSKPLKEDNAESTEQTSREAST